MRTEDLKIGEIYDLGYGIKGRYVGVTPSQCAPGKDTLSFNVTNSRSRYIKDDDGLTRFSLHMAGCISEV